MIALRFIRRGDPPGSLQVSPVPMPTTIVRCTSCRALLVDGVHADSGRRGCGWGVSDAG